MLVRLWSGDKKCEWPSLKTGYIYRRGWQFNGVVDVIQSGDLVGNTKPDRNGITRLYPVTRVERIGAPEKQEA